MEYLILRFVFWCMQHELKNSRQKHGLNYVFIKGVGKGSSQYLMFTDDKKLGIKMQQSVEET